MCDRDHDAIKADPERWSALEPVGLQPLRATLTKPARTLELRNCTCGSTLAKPIATGPK